MVSNFVGCLRRAAPLGLVWALAPPASAAPAPSVTVATVREENIAPTHEFVGRVDAIQTVQVHAMVQGTLEQVNFQEGSNVRAGQLLFVIDPDMYQAEVQNAQAAVERAQATLVNDNQTVARNQVLAGRGEAPQATLDQAVATKNADQAAVDAAQAQLRVAQINLGYTKITAPIAGRIGAAAVTKGNLVSTTTAVLATIVQLDPIRVVFSPDDASLVRAEQGVGADVATLTKKFLPRLKFSDGAAYDQPGVLSFISNQVDPTTGTIPIYAQFPNPKGLLLPNQYVTVAVKPAAPENRLLVPVAAVQQDNLGKFVLLVGSDNKVAQQRFEATQQLDQDWVVDKGLQAGERVIVAGVQKAHAGEVVSPQPAPATSPAASLAQPGG